MPFSPAIEACRVPDERLAGAYEETSAAHRSWIKTTLALAEATYPAPPSRLTITSENAAAGFGFARTRETAPWAVLLIGEGYASAVRLAAAIMPARLAGVEPVFAVWTGAETAPSGLFAACSAAEEGAKVVCIEKAAIGGGVRDNIKVGDITYGDIIKVHPFGNEACLVEVTGQQIKDALELGSAAYPGESGGFLQVSGLTYTINADIPSSVVKNDKSEFVKVDGAYRVSDIMVGGQPLDVNKTYTLASHNYMLKDAGDGYTMFGTKNVKLLKDGVMIDNQVLINYIVNNLGGVVGEQYAAPQGRITIKTAASDVPTNESEKVIAGRDTTVTEGDTYTVVAGDCLWNIAYKLYGTGTLYTKLAEANKLADPYIIYIGQILTVPAK